MSKEMIKNKFKNGMIPDENDFGELIDFIDKHASETEMAELENTITKINDNLSIQGKSIQDLVAEGQLTPAQYATLIKSINNMAEKSEVRENTHTRPINVSEMDTETKKLFTGGAVAVVGENSVGSENVKLRAIDENRTSFLKAGKNKFGGTFIPKLIARGSEDESFYSTLDLSKSAVMKIDKGDTYTVTKFVGGDRFNIMVLDKYPSVENSPIAALYTYRGIDDSTEIQSHTFTNSHANGEYLLVHTNSYVESVPKIQVEYGTESTDYAEPSYILDKPLEGYKKEDHKEYLELVKSDKNLFDGKYVRGWLRRSPSKDAIDLLDNWGSYDGRVAIIPIQPNTTYTVSIPRGGHDRFIVGITNAYPTVGYVLDTHIYEGYADIFDPGLLEITFKSTEQGKYVVIYPSSEGKELELQLEVGGEATSYEPYMYAPSKFLPSMNPPLNNDGSGVPSDTAGYVFSDELTGMYSANEVISFENPVSVQADYIYQLYDDLLVGYPQYVTKEKIGDSEDGLPIYKYLFKPSTLDTHLGLKTPKVLVTSGTHGLEKGPVYSLYNMVEKMCNGWNEDSTLEFLRFNIELIVVPLVNPDGFNAHRRNNSNNVNLNRNFPNGWVTGSDHGSAASSESETRALVGLIDKNKDAEFCIDYHNMYFRDGYMAYTWTADKLTSEVTSQVIKALGRKWQKDYPFFPQEVDHSFGYTTAHLGGSLAYYAQKYGIRDSVLEIVRQIDWQEAGSQYDELTIKCGLELLVNTLKTSFKTAWKI